MPTGRHAVEILHRSDTNARMRRFFTPITAPEDLAKVLETDFDRAVAMALLNAAMSNQHFVGFVTHDEDLSWPASRERIFTIIKMAMNGGYLPEELHKLPDIVTLTLYPRACAHLICGSLGYACATKAARMLSAVHDGKAVYNEWAYDYACRSYTKMVETGRRCVRNQHLGNGDCTFDGDWVFDPDHIDDCCMGRCHEMEKVQNTKPFSVHEVDASRKLTASCTNALARKGHSGYMADYQRGRVVVAREILGVTPQPSFAAWF